MLKVRVQEMWVQELALELEPVLIHGDVSVVPLEGDIPEQGKEEKGARGSGVLTQRPEKSGSVTGTMMVTCGAGGRRRPCRRGRRGRRGRRPWHSRSAPAPRGRRRAPVHAPPTATPWRRRTPPAGSVVVLSGRKKREKTEGKERRWWRREGGKRRGARVWRGERPGAGLIGRGKVMQRGMALGTRVTAGDEGDSDIHGGRR